MENSKVEVVLEFGHEDDWRVKEQAHRQLAQAGMQRGYLLRKTVKALAVGEGVGRQAYRGRVALARDLGVPVVSMRYVEACATAGRVLDPKGYELQEADLASAFAPSPALVPTFSSLVLRIATPAPLDADQLLQRCAATPLSDVEAASSGVYHGLWAEVYASPSHIVRVELQADSRSGQARVLCSGARRMGASRIGPVSHVVRHADRLDAGSLLYGAVQRSFPATMLRIEAPESLHQSLSGGNSWNPSTGVPTSKNEIARRSLVRRLFSESRMALSAMLTEPLARIRRGDLVRALGALRLVEDYLRQGGRDPEELRRRMAAVTKAVPLHLPPIADLSLVDEARQVLHIAEDLKSLGETQDGRVEDEADVLYRSLHCEIHRVEEAAELQAVLHSLQQDSSRTSVPRVVIDRVVAVYRLNRESEEAAFEQECAPIRRLWHGSKASRWAGVLARGLLLPEVVLRAGLETTDVGLLGRGLYFSPDADTALQYTSAERHGGRRFLLACDVAVGRMAHRVSHSIGATAAPEGYDSVRGVPRSEDRSSVFADHEIVVYRVSQQKLAYLVELEASILDDPTHVPKENDRSSAPQESRSTTKNFRLFTNKSKAPPPPPNLEANPSGNIPPSSSSPKFEAFLKGVDENAVAQFVAQQLQQLHASPMDAGGLTVRGGGRVRPVGVNVRGRVVDFAAEMVLVLAYVCEAGGGSGEFVFPVDERAAVCGLEAHVGARRVVGEIRTKEAARTEYREAVSRGQAASLLEQEREDRLRLALGAIPNGADVVVVVRYVVELEAVDGRLLLAVPLNFGMAAAPLDVQLELEMAGEIRSLTCPSHPPHALQVKRTETRACVRVLQSAGGVRGEFALEVAVADVHEPRIWAEADELGSFASMVAFYPSFEIRGDWIPVYYIGLDASRSTRSCRMDMARASLQLLHILSSGSESSSSSSSCKATFNVVVFGDSCEALFETPRSVGDSAALALARRFLCAFASRPMDAGGTAVASLLARLALRHDESASPASLLLLTDGLFADSDASLAALVRRHVRRLRVFPLGVGADVDAPRLRGLARMAAGRYLALPPNRLVADRRLRHLLRIAAQPLLANVRVRWADLPEISCEGGVYAGERLVVYRMGPSPVRSATLSASWDGSCAVEQCVAASELRDLRGVLLHRLATRAKLKEWIDEALDDDPGRNAALKEATAATVLDLALAYSVMSSLTSLVAVDREAPSQCLSANLPAILGELFVDPLPYLEWTQSSQESDGFVEDHFGGELVGFVSQELPMGGSLPIVDSDRTSKPLPLQRNAHLAQDFSGPQQTKSHKLRSRRVPHKIGVETSRLKEENDDDEEEEEEEEREEKEKECAEFASAQSWRSDFKPSSPPKMKAMPSSSLKQQPSTSSSTTERTDAAARAFSKPAAQIPPSIQPKPSPSYHPPPPPPPPAAPPESQEEARELKKADSIKQHLASRLFSSDESDGDSNDSEWDEKPEPVVLKKSVKEEPTPFFLFGSQEGNWDAPALEAVEAEVADEIEVMQTPEKEKSYSLFDSGSATWDLTPSEPVALDKPAADAKVRRESSSMRLPPRPAQPSSPAPVSIPPEESRKTLQEEKRSNGFSFSPAATPSENRKSGARKGGIDGGGGAGGGEGARPRFFGMNTAAISGRLATGGKNNVELKSEESKKKKVFWASHSDSSSNSSSDDEGEVVDQRKPSLETERSAASLMDLGLSAPKAMTAARLQQQLQAGGSSNQFQIQQQLQALGPSGRSQLQQPTVSGVIGGGVPRDLSNVDSLVRKAPDLQSKLRALTETAPSVAIPKKGAAFATPLPAKPRESFADLTGRSSILDSVPNQENQMSKRMSRAVSSAVDLARKFKEILPLVEILSVLIRALNSASTNRSLALVAILEALENVQWYYFGDNPPKISLPAAKSFRGIILDLFSAVRSVLAMVPKDSSSNDTDLREKIASVTQTINKIVVTL